MTNSLVAEAGAANESTRGGRSVIDGAFALLEALADGSDMGLTSLASAAGLPKATAHRLLDQLVGHGAVQRWSGRYRLGPRVFRLGQAWRPARQLRAAAARPIGSLAAGIERGGFSLSVLDRGQVMVVTGIGREIDELVPLRAGTLLPIETAAGRILTPAEHPTHLAYDTGSWLPVSCVAAPVFTPSGKVVAALAATTFNRAGLGALTEPVRRAAAMVSTNLARLSASAS
jgi:DNA-binding IclR family transcriptional regulator